MSKQIKMKDLLKEGTEKKLKGFSFGRTGEGSDNFYIRIPDATEVYYFNSKEFESLLSIISSFK